MSALDDIRQRAGAATEGPWMADTEVRGDCVVWGPDGQFLMNQQAAPHWTPDAYGHTRMVAYDVDRRDGQFIAHARTDVPRLLGALDAVLALADKWAALGPADDWAEGGMADTVLADAGRAFRNAVNDALEAGK